MSKRQPTIITSVIHPDPLLSHRNYSKGGLALHLCDTMELPHPIDIKERTKPWDTIAQFSHKSCG